MRVDPKVLEPKVVRKKESKFFKYNEPLKMPRGSVRSLVTLLIVAGSIAYSLIYKGLPVELMGVLSTILGYYFGSRMAESSGKEKEEDLPEAQ